ncbi:MAG: glutamine-synthetase adenylyltransferase [Bdellovibrionaceae bacterium]|nr:glutamine-synthetase adenylyltransferase [Pseudobdellovibrionaceae bacterium]
MTKLRTLASYSASEISEAKAFSPVLAHYLPFADPTNKSLQQKRTIAWIEAALATILNKNTAFEICTSWSHTANEILTSAFHEYFPEDPVMLFALGKLGSLELNLSSDVDILLVSKEESAPLLKSLRQFQKALSDRTAKGFIFRVDFDLRPGGRNGPLIPTIEQFLDYYGNYGETWERLAFVRLAAITGDQDIQSQASEFAKKFTFRKHLDYTLLDDLKNLRSKIRQHYSPRSSDSVWDLKLGIGGIRDVELFVHALQVIHGGKNANLQVRGTGQALKLLKDSKILPAADCDFLEAHYWRLRSLENLVQSKNDEQTHLYEKAMAVPEWASTIVSNLEEDLENCDRIVGSLLGVSSSPIAETSIKSSTTGEIWDEILKMDVLSRNKDRDEHARLQFLNEFFETLLKQKGDIDKALQHLKEFIKSTRAKASFFTLLVRNKNLMDELAWLFGHSPYLSQILSSRPELIDSYVYRSQDLQQGDLGLLLEQLVEKRLLGELINGSHYLEDRNVENLQVNLSDTADEICRSLLDELKKEFPSTMQILALGKWGGRELGFRSDLDFILVSEAEPNEVDSKLARRLINRLTELRKGGNIYAIDMRLKPSGKAGPMVISTEQLQDFFKSGAQAWERQVYLKSRWVTGTSQFDTHLILGAGLTTQDLLDLEKIRAELVRFVPEGWDLKYSEGGLLDIELFSQTYLLVNSVYVRSPNTLDFLAAIAGAQDLRLNYLRLRQYEQMLQLVSTEGGAKVLVNHESFQQLATAFQQTSAELKNTLDLLFSENLQLLKDLDPRRGTKILDSGS